MGGAVSAGEDNDELIDNLVEAEYIKSPLVERVFRAIDRADYYADGCKENAYRDLAWKHGNLHLSAPCIYSEVMEYLQVVPSISFLNLGSGTGYLSTMVGLILGPYGVNHGVEIYSDVVDYAYTKLEEFKNTSPALDEYEFCQPIFIKGNCLLLNNNQQYDRIYCGASCPQEHENYMKNLIRVGGILVMPLNDHLFQIIRTSETSWEMKSILPVSFASLVLPSPDEALESVILPEPAPLSLQEICRSIVRFHLRRNISAENPALKNKRRRCNTKRKKDHRVKQIVIPLFEENFEGSFNAQVNENDREDEHHFLSVPSKIDSRSNEQNSFIYSSTETMVIDESGSNECITPLQTETEELEDQKPGVNNQRDFTDLNATNGTSNENFPMNNHVSDSNIFKADMKGWNESSGNEFNKLPHGMESNDVIPEGEKFNNLHNGLSKQTVSHDNFHCEQAITVFLKHVDSDDDDENSSNACNERKSIDYECEATTLQNYYSYFMRKKINALPLPCTLKSYLNYQRPL